MSKRILYISYDGMTDPLGQSQVIPYLAGLSAKGYKITLLSAEKEENYNKHKTQIAHLLASKNIQWEPCTYTKSPPVFSTIKDIETLKRKAIILHKNNPFKIIHCRSYIAAFVGLYMKKHYQCKFLFDMRGFWADERIDGGIWSLSNPIYKQVYQFFKRKEKQFLKNADHIVSLTQAGKDEMLGWKSVALNADNISVIPCCADLNHFDFQSINNKDKATWRKQWGITEHQFVISYLGSIGTWYMLNEMLAFFKVLLEEKPDAIFLFITKENPKLVLEKAQNYGINEKSLIINPAERHELPSMLSLSHASLFFIKPVWSKKASSPTKMAELMGMGIPIVANAGVGDVDAFMAKNPSGILVNEFTTSDYKRAISELLSLADPQKEKVRELACNNFSLAHGISIFDKIYENLH